MKKKIIIIVISILAIILVGILLLINSKWGRDLLSKRDIRSLSKTFYEYYYKENNFESNKNSLKKFNNSGLVITLGDLEVYVENKTNSKVNYKSLEKCDRANTKVIIYPKKPYNSDSYELKFDLVCN